MSNNSPPLPLWLITRLYASKKAIDEMEIGQAFMIDTYGKEGTAYPLPPDPDRSADEAVYTSSEAINP